MPEIREHWSPNKEKFSKLLKEALADYDDYDESQRRPVDYSFLYTVPGVVVKRGPSRKVILKAVAGILIFCMAIAGAAVWLNPDTAFAGKIKKIFYILTNGLFSTDPKDEYFDESANIFKIETMDDIGKSKKFLPELLVPQYIPEQYKFETLEIKKYISTGNYILQYQYKTGLKHLKIDIKMDGNVIADIPEDGDAIKENDLLMWEDTTTGSRGVIAVKGNISISVTGDAPVDDMFEIVKNLE